MWYPAATTVDPETEPLTADDAKLQSRIFFDDDDAYLNTLIAAARDHIERYCAIRLMTQTVAVKCDSFDDFSRIPVAPVQSIVSVAYIDTAGAAQTLDPSAYELRADDLDAAVVRSYGAQWPAIQLGSRIVVTAIVGYANLPPAIKHALLLKIGDAYENRENAADVSWSAFDSLLSNFRRGA